LLSGRDSLLFGPSLILVPAAPPSNRPPFFVVALILGGFGGIVFNITGISSQQAVTPDRTLGRLNATRCFIVWGVISVGFLAGAVLASQVGLRPTLWIGAIGASFSFLPLVLSPVRSIGRMADTVREHGQEVVPKRDA